MDSQPDEWMKIGDVPDLLHGKGWDRPSLATVRAWIRLGKINGMKRSGRVYVEVRSLSNLETPMTSKKEEDNATLSTTTGDE